MRYGHTSHTLDFRDLEALHRSHLLEDRRLESYFGFVVHAVGAMTAYWVVPHVAYYYWWDQLVAMTYLLRAYQGIFFQRLIRRRPDIGVAYTKKLFKRAN